METATPDVAKFINFGIGEPANWRTGGNFATSRLVRWLGGQRGRG